MDRSRFIFASLILFASADAASSTTVAFEWRSTCTTSIVPATFMCLVVRSTILSSFFCPQRLPSLQPTGLSPTAASTAVTRSLRSISDRAQAHPSTTQFCVDDPIYQVPLPCCSVDISIARQPRSAGTLQQQLPIGRRNIRDFAPAQLPTLSVHTSATVHFGSNDWLIGISFATYDQGGSFQPDLCRFIFIDGYIIFHTPAQLITDYVSLTSSVQSSPTGPTTRFDSLIRILFFMQPAGIYRFIFRDGYEFPSVSAQLLMDSTTIDPILSFPTSAILTFHGLLISFTPDAGDFEFGFVIFTLDVEDSEFAFAIFTLDAEDSEFALNIFTLDAEDSDFGFIISTLVAGDRSSRADMLTFNSLLISFTPDAKDSEFAFNIFTLDAEDSEFAFDIFTLDAEDSEFGFDISTLVAGDRSSHATMWTFNSLLISVSSFLLGGMVSRVLFQQCSHEPMINNIPTQSVRSREVLSCANMALDVLFRIAAY